MASKVDIKVKTPEEVLAKRKKYLLPAVSHYFDRPPLFVRGAMQYLYDSEGKEYLDFFAGIVTVGAGHANPKIAARIKEQVDTLQHTSTLYLTGQMEDLAEKLAQIAPGPLQKSFITSSGAEATEGAALLAKAYTKSQEFIALRHSFHGRTLMGMSLTGQSNWRVGNPYAFGVNFVSPAYCYRCPFGQTYGKCNIECAQDVENVIRTSTSTKIAGMFAETILGNGGVIDPPPEYFPIVKKTLEKYGALLISDEVQTGFARTGKWFGIEHWGVQPDIITMAKGIGNGLAVGAFITTDEIAGALGPGQHFTTFGGNPVSSVGALANIEFIEEEHLAQNAATVGAYLKDKLKALQEKHPLIGDVRGKGLMLGVELVKDRKTKEPAAAAMKFVLEFCKDKGLLVGKGGLDGNIMRIKPPLIITKENVDHAVPIIDAALTAAAQTN